MLKRHIFILRFDYGDPTLILMYIVDLGIIFKKVVACLDCFLVMIIKLLRFLKRDSYRNHHAKFKIDMTILTFYIKISISYGRMYGRTDPNYNKASLSKIKLYFILLFCCLPASLWQLKVHCIDLISLHPWFVATKHGWQHS